MSAIQDLVDLAQRVDTDRRHLRSVAFQLLGSVADADDAVQSTWLKASRSDYETLNDIENLAGWFTTITAHEAVDQPRVRKRRAERPLVDSAELDPVGNHGVAAGGPGRSAGGLGRQRTTGRSRPPITRAVRCLRVARRVRRAVRDIHTIDIIGDADRVRRAVLTLPRWPSQNYHRPIGYQGHRTKPALQPRKRPATGQREHDAR